ncbi:transglutaminase domain-containing protein [Archangium primigenium]|uniref:transglutaminase domain-containing protein n=1 Tax=[Archangium] primigenium TaxID=2792470 RepID=UPI001EF99FE1|nr:transglutaminase domain-containing protein [Archangium primigenium]
MAPMGDRGRTVPRLAARFLLRARAGRPTAGVVAVLLAWTTHAGELSGEDRFVFSWRGIPLGTVTLAFAPEARRFLYTSRHVHTRGGHVGQRTREVALVLDAKGRVEGRGSVPQTWWLWRGPPAPGCVTGREELSGREGPHCVTGAREGHVEGTMLGQAFTADYDARGRLREVVVGASRFVAVAPGTRTRPPPDLFVEGVAVEGGTRGALRFEPAWPLVARPAWVTDWRADEARALAAEVHAAFAEKAPGAADWSDTGEGEGGACLAHAARFAARAAQRGRRVALVQGLLVVDGGPGRPHAWVRVGLAGGRTLDLDPTSLDAVRPDTHLPLALAEPGTPAVEAGERWLALLRGEHRVVRAGP